MRKIELQRSVGEFRFAVRAAREAQLFRGDAYIGAEQRAYHGSIGRGALPLPMWKKPQVDFLVTERGRHGGGYKIDSGKQAHAAYARMPLRNGQAPFAAAQGASQVRGD